MKSLVWTLLFVGMITFSFAAEKESKPGAKTEKADLTSVNGQVTDKATDEVLVGVKVILEGTDQVTYTDFDGKFTFNNIEAGKYNITASYISYEKSSLKDVPLSLNKNQVDFSLGTAN